MAFDGMDGGAAQREIILHIINYVPLSTNLHQPQKSSAITFYILVKKHFYLAPANPGLIGKFIIVHNT
jgi:hypothetical protein